jgi:hypothetical protein
MDGGKYSHHFIPKYPCVVTQIMLGHGLTSPHVYNLWRQLYAMRQEAAYHTKITTNIGGIEQENREIQWIRLLLGLMLSISMDIIS